MLKPNQLVLSIDGINLIKKWESFKPTSYVCPAGKLTIGYGHVIGKDEDKLLKMTIDESIATDLLSQDLIAVERTIESKVKVALTQGQYDALCSLIYNIGSGAFSRSKGLIFLNKGMYAQAAEEFFSEDKGFVKININTSKGLVNRRNDEMKLWVKEDIDEFLS